MDQFPNLSDADLKDMVFYFLQIKGLFTRKSDFALNLAVYEEKQNNNVIVTGPH
jgi:hypothetical protein